MSQLAWRIATDTKTYTADDLSGAGAKISGGRWNDVGVAMIYASINRSLACLETFVHLNAGALPLNRYLVELEIPDNVWADAKFENISTLKIGWDAEPSGIVSISHGSEWAKVNRSAVLVVPSVIVPEEYNILINPAHPDASKIKATKIRKWLYDPRMEKILKPPL